MSFFHWEELTDRQQAFEIEEHVQRELDAGFWADDATERANDLLDTLGFEPGARCYKRGGPSMVSGWDADIGAASIEASYRTYPKGLMTRVRETYPTVEGDPDHFNNRVHRLAQDLIDIQRPWMYRLCFDVGSAGGYYDADNRVTGIINDITGDEPYANLREIGDRFERLEDQLSDWVSDVASLVGSLYRDECEHVMSGEGAVDHLRIETFDECGVDLDIYEDGIPEHVQMALVPEIWRWRATPAGETLATWAAKHGRNFAPSNDYLAVVAYDEHENEHAFALVTEPDGSLFEGLFDGVWPESEGAQQMLLHAFAAKVCDRVSQSHEPEARTCQSRDQEVVA